MSCHFELFFYYYPSCLACLVIFGKLNDLVAQMLGLLGCGRRMLNSHEGELTLLILNFSLKSKKPGMPEKVDY